MRISHEAIYQAIYVQGRGALRHEVVACLRTGRALRIPRARARQRATGHVTAEVMISKRPAEAVDAARTDSRHRAVEFIKFLDLVDASVPADLDVHVIIDNASTHKTPPCTAGRTKIPDRSSGTRPPTRTSTTSIDA